jgi:PAS domain-containing protein
LGAITTGIDVTELKTAEQTACAARAMLEAALASMSDAVFISDADGNLVHMNQAFARFHRLSSPTLPRQNIRNPPPRLGWRAILDFTRVATS